MKIFIVPEGYENDDDDAPSKGPLFIGLALIAFICIFILIGVKEAVDKTSENSNNNTTESRVETTENVESEYEGYTISPISPIVVNEYSRDTTTDKSKFSYGCSRLYFHFKVEAKSSHESTPLIIRIKYPDNKEVEEVKLSENLDGKYIHRRVEPGNDVA